MWPLQLALVDVNERGSTGLANTTVVGERTQRLALGAGGARRRCMLGIYVTRMLETEGLFSALLGIVSA